jgi:hypothetical protein
VHFVQNTWMTRFRPSHHGPTRLPRLVHHHDSFRLHWVRDNFRYQRSRDNFRFHCLHDDFRFHWLFYYSLSLLRYQNQLAHDYSAKGGRGVPSVVSHLVPAEHEQLERDVVECCCCCKNQTLVVDPCWTAETFQIANSWHGNGLIATSSMLT